MCSCGCFVFMPSSLMATEIQKVKLADSAAGDFYLLPPWRCWCPDRYLRRIRCQSCGRACTCFPPGAPSCLQGWIYREGITRTSISKPYFSRIELIRECPQAVAFNDCSWPLHGDSFLSSNLRYFLISEKYEFHSSTLAFDWESTIICWAATWLAFNSCKATVLRACRRNQ